MNRPVSSTLATLSLVLGLSACATPPPEGQPPSAGGDPDKTTQAVCDAKSLSWTMGQVADEALVERARVESGSKTVRVLKPGMMITAEYSATRLNLRVDNDRKVLSYSCG